MSFTPNDALLCALKKLELCSQNMILELPHNGSEVYKRIDLEEWELRMCFSMLAKIQTAAKNANVKEWMVGKE